MINEQRDGRNGVSFDVFSILLALLAQLLVELDEEQSLVLYIREEVVLSDEIKDIRATQAQEVWECFAWLAVERVELRETFHQDDGIGAGRFLGRR